MSYFRILQSFFVLALLLAAPMARSSEASVALETLKAKGCEPIESMKGLTGLTFKYWAQLTEADYRLIHQFATLKTLSFGGGFNDADLKAIGSMPELDSLATNGMEVTDEGIATLANFPKLRVVAFFHPGKGFTGTGLTSLAKLPGLEHLTVAGSSTFGDVGLAAVTTLQTLKEFRTWHTAITIEGLKKLSTLKQLTTLTLGQRLTNAPPLTLSDPAIEALTSCASLESINLQEARLTLNALTQLKKLPKLRRLKLEAIDIPEPDITALKSQLKGVEVNWTPPDANAQKRIDALYITK